MRRCHGLLLVVLLLLVVHSSAEGHFLWIEPKPASGKQSQVEAYFCEAAHPGEKKLIGKIAHTQAWLRDTSGKQTTVALQAATEEDHAALVGNAPNTNSASLEAFCDYGVYSHGGPGILVQYYAKHLPSEWLDDTRLTKSDALRLDVIPHVAGDKLTIHVLFDGKPIGNREVVMVDPTGNRHDQMTDADGNVTTSANAPGRYTIRAGNIETDKSGERDGKKYLQTWHYSTLIFDLPAAAKAATDSTPAKP